MKLAFLQTELHWELADENRNHVLRELQGLEPVDLVVLPEMFTTGFSMRTQALAESMTGPTVEWMHALAQATEAVICGSVIVASERGYTNRLLWVSPLGDVQYYDKRHLFRMAQEHQHYSAGQEKLVTSLAGFNCCPLICYDLRFPHLYRDLAQHGAHILTVPSAFSPVTGGAHWNSLLRARAIENGCFVIAPAQTGEHAISAGKPRSTYGHSLVVDPWGEVLLDAGTATGAHVVDLDLASVQIARDRIPALQHDRIYAKP